MLREEIDESVVEAETAYTWAPEPRRCNPAQREAAHREAAHREPAQRDPAGEPAQRDPTGESAQQYLASEPAQGEPAQQDLAGEPAQRDPTGEPAQRDPAQGEPVLDWRTVDRALRDIKRRRASLDAEEMYWLREADKLQIWRPLGMVSALDYLERVLGYAPRTAQERLRVARALGNLPLLSAALADDTLAFSAVRELTRVATPSTEPAWLAAATGKNLRQIEDIVADHRPGDNPDDPPDPKARPHIVRFEVNAETYALLRQTRTILNDEHGENLSDDALITALCNAVLDGAATTEPTGRAKFQIALTLCRRCQQGWQEGSGAQIPIDPSVVERALCDGQHIGSIDGSEPERAYQDIPPSVARFVWRRDGGRCRVDGCRSGRGLELHHVIHRADGGSHEASNLVLCCSSCHQAHHAGLLAISGTADNLVVQRLNGSVPRASATQPHFRDRTASAAATRTHVDAPTAATRAHALVDAPAAVTAATRALVDAPATPTAATRAHALVDAPATPTAATRAHVDAPATPTAATRAYVDAPATPTAPTADTRAHALVDAPATPTAASAATRAHVDAPSRLDVAILRVEAKTALTQLGWKPAIAHAAVAAALAAHGNELTLERLLFESLRRCPTPRG